MNQDYKHRFWIWSNKLNPVLSMLAHLAEYDLWDDEREAIKIGLKETNNEQKGWFDYIFKGKKYPVELKLAYDDEEGPDMIHLEIRASIELKEKLEALALFQSMFKELKE